MEMADVAADVPIEKVDDKPLGHCHLVDIKRYLNDLGRTTVTDLGLVLGVLFPTMRDLPNDDFLNRVITLWLDKADSVMSKGEPSWRSLVQGLRDKQVRQNGIANSIAKDHFITDVQSQEDIHVSDTNGATAGLTDTLSKQPEFQQLSLSEQENLMIKLYDDEKNMKLQFASLVTKTCESVEKRTTLKKFAASILALGAYKPVCEMRSRSLLEDHSEEINSAETISEIFTILNDYWNFLTYDVLEFIIDHFGDDSDKERLKNYSKNLQNFCERRTFEFPPESGNDSTLSPKQEKLTVKLDVREDSTYKDLLLVRGRIAKILQVNPAVLVLGHVDKGCVQLTFLIPTFLAQELFPLSYEKTSGLSKDASVIRLKCGHYVYESTSSTYTEDSSTQSTASLELVDESQLQKEPHAHQEVKAKLKHSGQYTNLLLCPIDKNSIHEISQYLQKFDKTHILHLGRTVGLSHSKLTKMMDSPSFAEDIMTAWYQREEQRGIPIWMNLINALLVQEHFEIDIDPDFSIHTSYHNDFFLLRIRVLVNGGNTEIRSVREGKYEGPVLNFLHSGSTVNTMLTSISRTVSPILVQYGVYHVDTFYYEQSPLFHVVFSSKSCLKNFILAIEEVKSSLEPKLQSLFLKSVLQAESAQQLTVEVQPDLFLVSPNRQQTKGAEVHLVTVENCSDFVTRWKDSKLFDFGALYQEKAKPPKVTSQPMSQKDVLPGKAVAFSVQATGTVPLKYQWQWKLFGKDGEEDGWQNLSGDSGTFRVKEVKASNAGYYRCVVSNSAGSETSQRASLTVVPEVCDLDSELHEVIDWIPLGLYLGIKLPELKIIEANYPKDLKMCRIEMFKEWQKNVTPTWSAVVQALVGIGMRRLASELAQKHGTPPPKLPDSDRLNQVENITQQEGEATASVLHKEVQKHRGNQLEQDRRKLLDADERLRDAQESKVKTNEKASEAVTKLEELHENVEKISEEKSNLERELKIKERECELLSAMQEKDAYNQVLQKKVDKKRKKIRSLKEKLQKKESELQSAMQDVQTKQEELSQAQNELKKQHEQVMKLQREKEELACSYSIEKEQFSKIVQLLVSDKEEMQQQLNNMKDESKFKSKQIEARVVEIHHLSKQIEVLSSSLQEKKAAATQLQSKLKKREQVASTQLLEFINLRTQIAELERKLQEAEEQKQKAELERDATVQEMKAKEKLKAQLHAHFDEPPKVTNQPKTMSKVCPGTAVVFAVQATGTEPLGYRWEWTPPEEEGGSEEWQPCHAGWCDGATLTIPTIQKSNEGSYRCAVSNYAGTQTSNLAKLSVADSPKITTHPQMLKDVVPGKYVMFSVEATGTEPLGYHWEWMPAEEEARSEEWQPCDAEWSDGSTLTIPNVQKFNEGSYRCAVSNYAGTQTSNLAKLSVADPPRITTHPRELKDAVPGKYVMFSVEATGTEPLGYKWEWTPAEEEARSEEWQQCDPEWSDGATLTIPNVQKFNEGSYRCAVSNYAGTQTSNLAKLSVADPPRITTHPRKLKDAVPGKYVMFSVEATGTEPLGYKWEWNPAGERDGTEEWQPCDLKSFPGADSSILSVQKFNKGSYRCVVSNCAGNKISNSAELETLQLPLQLRWRRYRDMKYAMTVPHCVVLERSVYVGGGDTGDDGEYYIQVFNMKTNQWSRLPRYQYRYFAMTVINHHLTLVGGRGGVGVREVTNQLAVYEPSSQHWTYPYNPMPTPRYHPAVLMYDIWLPVAGGGDASWTVLATVELFNTSTNQWLAASSLPTPCCSLTSAIVDNYGYLVMNSKEVFRVSLPDIVSQTVDQSTSKSPALWCRLPDTPLSCSAAISLRGYLLAVGGSHDNYTRSTDIHLYQPESEQWTKVGDLPNVRQYCSCVVLPSGELLVAGGHESPVGQTSRVDVASVLK